MKRIIDNEQLKQIETIIKETEIPNIIDVKVLNDTIDVSIKESIKINTESCITNIPE